MPTFESSTRHYLSEDISKAFMRVGLTHKPSKAQFDPTEEVKHLDCVIPLHRIKINDDRIEA